jgi:zinc protease
MRTAALALWSCLAAGGAAAQVSLPPHEAATLPNGIKLIMIPRQEIPMVTVRVVVRGGAEADPADRAGLGDLVGELLQRGAGTMDTNAFAERLDSLGAALEIETNAQATTVRLDFLSKDTDAALDLLATALGKPAFAETEVKKALADSIDAVKASKDDPGDALRSYAMAMMFGPTHPYGRVVDELSLARITRADMVEYHKKYFVGRNMIVAVAGDFDSKASGQSRRERVARWLGTLPAGEPHPWLPGLAAPSHDKPRLLLVDKPDATQTYFSIMMPGVERGHPDRAALKLVNALFGERFTSMLNDELRVNSGLSYGASSRVQLNRLPGAITMSSFTKTETTVQAIDLALTVLRRLREKGVDAAMLASSKAYVKGLFPTENLETDAQLAAVMGDLELFGLGRGEIDDLFSRLDAVTPEQATAVARRFYVDQNLQFCLVGKAAEIQKAVAKYAPSSMKVIPIIGPGFAVPAF